MQSQSTSEFKKAIDKCGILIEKKDLGNSDFVCKNKEIILNGLFGSENQRNLILHPHTNLIFFQSIVISAIYAFYNDSMNNKNLLSCLLPGDMVIHLLEKRRYKVIEVNSAEGYLKLEGSKGLTNKLPITAKFIKPYYGNARTLDGRGVRVSGYSGRDFFAALFEVDKDTIKTTIERSIVIVCQKQDADMIMESLVLKLCRYNGIRLGELFPCAYYTSATDWVNYAGNSANLDPVVKFTSKLSIARELVLEDEYKRIQGVIVNGSEYITSGISELNDILIKKSLHNVTLLAPINYGDYSQLLEQYAGLNLYAWTNEALLSVIEDLYDICVDNSLHDDIERTYRFIDNLCQKDIEIIKIESPYKLEINKICTHALFNLRKNMPDGEDKDYFITYGYSLLNLMEQSCFSIDMIENFVRSSKTNVTSPAEIIEQLDIISNKYSFLNTERYEDMRKVVDSLINMKEIIQKSNPKYDYLKKVLLYVASKKHEQIAVVMPKTYYCLLFAETLSDFERYKLSRFDFTTPNKLNMKKSYEKVFVLSIPEGVKFNSILLPNAPRVDFLCYELEQWRIDSLKLRTVKLMDYYDKKNSIKYDYFGLEEFDSEEIEADEKIYLVLDKYADNLLMKMTSETLNRTVQGSSSVSEVVKFVSFESGEYAFFTKHFLPYKYVPASGIIEETDIDSIEVGDTLVFAKIEDENKDIVDKVLNRLIESNGLNTNQEIAYRKSKHWKDVLRNYMSINNITFSELSARLLKIGKTKHEVTLRTWLEEDSRIVGPRDSESFYSVALLTGDQQMLDNPDEFCEACRMVRSMRIKILKFIGKSIINSVNSKTDDAFEETLSSITKDVSQMVKMLQIERIENACTAIPAYLANRPHYLS